MVEYEADDALGAAAAVADADPRVDAGDDRDARQGPRTMRAWHPSGAVRPTQGRDRRRGRRDRQVRRRTGVDRRLSGAGRRHGRRLPGAGRLGCQECGRGARQVRLDHREFRGRRAIGGSPACAARTSSPSRSATSSSWPCCSGGSPRSRPMLPSARSMTGVGPGRPAISRRSPTHIGAPHLVERANRLAERQRRLNETHPPAEVTARLSAAHKRYR